MLEPTTLPNKTVGPYTTSGFIGGGGFAWVMAAHREEGPEVALKVLKPKYAVDTQFVARFLNEAEVAGQLRHPNIIRIVDAGSQGKDVWFAMHRLKESLEAVLEEKSLLPEAEVVRTARDISRALAFAHDTGVIHRDIKPSNILFQDDGSAVLTDFGIARAVAGYISNTGKQLVLGTPHYISPEQARGMPLDGRTDLYALGVTMYRAATGDLPFRSSDWYELARLHVEEPPPPPRSKRPELSKPFERIILTCMAKDREERYLSASALADELDTLLDGNSRGPLSTTAEWAFRLFKKRSS
ncbi:MAG TPA: serine/threonine-protein kinase [Gemmatimonadales bacterium]